MTALIIRAPGRIIAPPPGTPIFPDISSGLYFDFDARVLNLLDGDSVAAWSGAGPAPAKNRLLNTAQSMNTWTLPTYSATDGPSGTPAVKFNGVNQRIRTTDASVIPYIGDFTIALVGQGSAPSGVTLSRLYGSSPGATTTISPASSGNIVFQQNGANVFSTPNPGGHFVVAFSVSKSRVIMLTSAMEDPKVISGSYDPGYTGFGLGGSAASALGTQMLGSVSRVTAFTRAFTVNGVAALVRAYRDEYGI
ncbi:hypothetical protein [Alcaligenes ammonioxydans]|uniref:hypothetical protein n=1 Tax=Alcaligenes ammonioxydans TaxID=2582914 RepID=UPI003D237A58